MSTYQPKRPSDIRCPLEFGLAVFGGKWKPRILCVLAARRVLRYAELRRELTDVSDAVLGAALRELARDGMVSREQFNEVPPRVEYRLTPKGESVVPILQSICAWAGRHERRNPTGRTLSQCESCDHGFGAAAAASGVPPGGAGEP